MTRRDLPKLYGELVYVGVNNVCVIPAAIPRCVWFVAFMPRMPVYACGVLCVYLCLFFSLFVWFVGVLCFVIDWCWGPVLVLKTGFCGKYSKFGKMICTMILVGKFANFAFRGAFSIYEAGLG